MSKHKYLIDWYEKSKFANHEFLSTKEEFKEIISLTSFLDGYYKNISFKQRMWHIKNDKFEIPKCKICGKPLAYHSKNGLYGYSTVCNDINCMSPNRKTFNIEILEKYTKHDYKCLCVLCKSEFIISVESYRTRKRRNKIICTICNPIDIKNKLIFPMLLRFLKSKFGEENVVMNDNKSIIVNNKFIVVHFIDNINANPKLYQEIDIINGLTAKEIWNNNQKYADSINPDGKYKIIIIWDLHWINEGKILRKNLLKIINE